MDGWSFTGTPQMVKDSKDCNGWLRTQWVSLPLSPQLSIAVLGVLDHLRSSCEGSTIHQVLVVGCRRGITNFWNRYCLLDFSLPYLKQKHGMSFLVPFQVEVWKDIPLGNYTRFTQDLLFEQLWCSFRQLLSTSVNNPFAEPLLLLVLSSEFFIGCCASACV